MLETDEGTVRKVAWPEIFPWLGIVRVFRLAISLRVLVLGAMGIMLTLLGWWGLAKVFSRSEPTGTYYQEVSGDLSWIKTGEDVQSKFPFVTKSVLPEAAAGLKAGPMLGTWKQLSRPVWMIFRDRSKWGVTPLAYLVLSALWAMAVWALLGGAISRIAAVQLAADERIGFGPALRFAASKWLSYLATPLLPLLGVALVAIPVAALGLLLRIDVGVLLAALVWPLALLAGLIMALLLLGLGFGWPLMWATISTEGTDSFDALSRSYAYVFQRPLRYLWYVLVAALLGWLGWLLVETFAAAVISLSYWAAGWGAGHRIDQVQYGASEMGRIFNAGGAILHFWVLCVRALAAGYFYGYFWTASTAIYLLLRRDVDATETDEVFLDADKSEPERGLPPLGTDQAGAPVAGDSSAKTKDDPSADEGE